MVKPVNTSFNKKRLLELGKSMNNLPEDLSFFKKTKRLFEQRLKMLDEDNLDWAMGELLAYATLLDEGYPIRISGQDVERGTFSHRHAALTQEDAEGKYYPLQHLSENQPSFEIYSSLLSEYAVVGFEYGYSFGAPKSLTIWEAQFGDFNNGAQIIYDQFMSAAEDKWNSMNGLVLLLPHGYEGQGAEHSSARMERFLQLAAEDNMYILNCTTPANMFHALRRQMVQNFRKPLVIFTPKSLLRHPKCVSSVKDFAEGKFQYVIDDAKVTKKDVKRVVFCSGKLYYDLLAAREENENDKVALVRLEQIYPLPEKELKKVLNSYKNAEVIWAQEEPENMGAYSYLLRIFDRNLKVISRNESASPASGSGKVFKRRQQEIIDQVFDI